LLERPKLSNANDFAAKALELEPRLVVIDEEAYLVEGDKRIFWWIDVFDCWQNLAITTGIS